MDVTFAFYLTAGAAVLLTGLSKSGFGGGLGVMAVPLMSLHVAPQDAAAIMMPILLAMDVLIVWRYRTFWDPALVWSLMPAAFLGLALGAMTFQYMNADVLKALIGLLAALFVGLFVATFLRDKPQSNAPTPYRRVTVYGLGCLSGFASFIAHAGGPPVKGYLLQQKLEKSRFVGTNTVFFFGLNLIKTMAYGAFGTMSAASLQISLLLAPLLVLGVLLGFWLHRRIHQEAFVIVVYTVLAGTAARLLYEAAGALLA